MQSRQRGISNVDIYNMDIVTILILDERIWKVALLHIVSRADSVFFFAPVLLICFCFRFLATFQKWLNNN